LLKFAVLGFVVLSPELFELLANGLAVPATGSLLLTSGFVMGLMVVSVGSLRLPGLLLLELS